MKKIISYCLIAIFALVLVACGGDEPKEYTLELTGAQTAVVGDEINLQATSDLEGAVFVWSSSDDTIATVDQTGVVTALTAGTVTIKVKVETVGEKTLTITITAKDYTPAELKTLLTTKLGEYKNSNNVNLKLSVTGEENFVSQLILNKNSNGGIDSLMNKLEKDGVDFIHVYVKDGYSYTLLNETYTKSQMTTTEENAIKTTYGVEKFVEKAASFYTEDAFFNSLTLDSRNDNVLTYTLNLTTYTGSSLVTTGIDSITLKVTLASEQVAKVEVSSVKGSATNTATLEYLGLTQQTITYPDLSAYVG